MLKTNANAEEGCSSGKHKQGSTKARHLFAKERAANAEPTQHRTPGCPV
ncbi:hypothetical protein [Salinibacillus xinjiangensis]|uniref:Uncharacterized protein n=1 Tax=Salinibacillus xinjiangensis TaxID=1229268 RepID=A0A6G1X507_9BACI|nr:hypothetical protein [Salinibacillus xinjiangensis]MRG85960.1 hypothetical protein [Salinibacillus xinjiangensis]